MGMFDSFRAIIKCPFCGKSSEMEMQTKRYGCSLENWRIGDEVKNVWRAEENEKPDNENARNEILRLTASCSSEKCRPRRHYATHVLVRIHVENGIFSKAEVVDVAKMRFSDYWWLEKRFSGRLAHEDDDWCEDVENV